MKLNKAQEASQCTRRDPKDSASYLTKDLLGWFLAQTPPPPSSTRIGQHWHYPTEKIAALFNLPVETMAGSDYTNHVVMVCVFRHLRTTLKPYLYDFEDDEKTGILHALQQKFVSMMTGDSRTFVGEKHNSLESALVSLNRSAIQRLLDEVANESVQDAGRGSQLAETFEKAPSEAASGSQPAQARSKASEKRSRWRKP